MHLAQYILFKYCSRKFYYLHEDLRIYDFFRMKTLTFKVNIEQKINLKLIITSYANIKYLECLLFKCFYEFILIPS